MYSKVRIAGHPVHPMIVAYPIASYTGTLAAFAVYAANGNQFWLNLAIALSVVGSGTAILAAVPGFTDWLLGIPRESKAKAIGVIHAVLNVVALGLFIATAAKYFPHWNGPATSATLGLALSAAGVACTLAAGFFGWTLVQDYHVGVRLSSAQEHDEPAVQSRHMTPVGGSHRAV